APEAGAFLGAGGKEGRAIPVRRPASRRRSVDEPGGVRGGELGVLSRRRRETSSRVEESEPGGGGDGSGDVRVWDRQPMAYAMGGLQVRGPWHLRSFEPQPRRGRMHNRHGT